MTEGMTGRVRRHREDRGAVAVEFALVLPLLIMLLFGVTTTGLAYSDHLAITNAVREAARLGASTPYDPANPTIWGDSVQQRVEQVYFNASSSINDNQICVQLVDSSGNEKASPSDSNAGCGTAPTAPAAVVAGSCLVKVWVSKPQEISLVVFPKFTFNIGAESVSYYGRTVGACSAS